MLFAATAFKIPDHIRAACEALPDQLYVIIRAKGGNIEHIFLKTQI